ncbi:hypothetical protein D9758_005316 [Tetrapyrgos nigripes]|uniref:Uncharacterized protein n=1 Tax=Tetrapyrgos nigripes TaxID=182062 RepID=A0A8H5GX19_9AGAR|nr:hypothetical protein D9758_005316 [Tetrapyrgos nigripes]
MPSPHNQSDGTTSGARVLRRSARVLVLSESEDDPQPSPKRRKLCNPPDADDDCDDDHAGADTNDNDPNDEQPPNYGQFFTFIPATRNQKTLAVERPSQIHWKESQEDFDARTERKRAEALNRARAQNQRNLDHAAQVLRQEPTPGSQDHMKRVNLQEHVLRFAAANPPDPTTSFPTWTDHQLAELRGILNKLSLDVEDEDEGQEDEVDKDIEMDKDR